MPQGQHSSLSFLAQISIQSPRLLPVSLHEMRGGRPIYSGADKPALGLGRIVDALIQKLRKVVELPGERMGREVVIPEELVYLPASCTVPVLADTKTTYLVEIIMEQREKLVGFCGIESSGRHVDSKQ